MSDKIHLVVKGMTCGGCENAVTRVLLNTSGVETVTASHKSDSVDVTFDASKVAPDVLREKIASLGYAVAP